MSFAFVAKKEFTDCLAELVDNGFVLDYGERKFQISEEATKHIEVSMMTRCAMRALAPRSNGDLALKDKTTFELLELTLGQGWGLLPCVNRKTEPLSLEQPLTVEDKLVYFNKSGLDINKSYLECILSIDSLKERGQPFIVF